MLTVNRCLILFSVCIVKILYNFLFISTCLDRITKKVLSMSDKLQEFCPSLSMEARKERNDFNLQNTEQGTATSP